MRDVNPMPESDNPEYVEKWRGLSVLNSETIKKVIDVWLGKK